MRTVSLTRSSPAAALRTQTGGNVHRRPDISVAVLDRLARVHADAYRDRGFRVIAVHFRHRFQDLETATNGGTDRSEDDVEAVALGLDLGALVFSDGLSDERAVSVEQGRSGGRALVTDIGGIAAEVGEQEPAG